MGLSAVFYFIGTLLVLLVIPNAYRTMGMLSALVGAGVLWIPFVGVIFSLWSLYLMIKGVSTLHKVSMVRAVLIIFLPFVIMIVLFGGLGAYFALSAFGS